MNSKKILIILIISMITLCTISSASALCIVNPEDIRQEREDIWLDDSNLEDDDGPNNKPYEPPMGDGTIIKYTLNVANNNPTNSSSEMNDDSNNDSNVNSDKNVMVNQNELNHEKKSDTNINLTEPNNTSSADNTPTTQTSTIPMKETGIPIIALAIAMILSIFTNRRKK